MDFSVERFGGRKTSYFESGVDSPLQIVFVPGMFNPGIWKHQLNYFGSRFRTVSYGIERGDYLSHSEALEDILAQDGLENVVLVSQGFGNALAQELEHREEVVATVLTGTGNNSLKLPRRLHKLLLSALKSEPKLFKKVFFSSITDYSVARQFLEDVELPSHRVYSSFYREQGLRRPIKKSMVVHPEGCRFSSIAEARRLKPDASVSVIKDVGSFSFYEKPQEYNKAVLDFLRTLKGFIEDRKVSRARQQNRSLKEFVEIPGEERKR